MKVDSTFIDFAPEPNVTMAAHEIVNSTQRDRALLRAVLRGDTLQQIAVARGQARGHVLADLRRLLRGARNGPRVRRVTPGGRPFRN